MRTKIEWRMIRSDWGIIQTIFLLKKHQKLRENKNLHKIYIFGNIHILQLYSKFQKKRKNYKYKPFKIKFK